MIGTTLDFVAKEMNRWICQRLELDPEKDKQLILSNSFEAGGKDGEDVLVLRLVGIYEDPDLKNLPLRPEAGDPGALAPRPIVLNLDVLLAARFRETQARAALDRLSLAIDLLHDHPIWTHQAFPGLPPEIGSFRLVMKPLSVEQRGQLWGSLGCDYLPSALYQLRIILRDDDGEIRPVEPSVKRIE